MKITFKFLWMIFWCHIQDMFTFSQVTAVFFLLKGCFVRNGPVTHVEFDFGCCMSKRSSSLSLFSSSLLFITISAAALTAHTAVQFLRALLRRLWAPIHCPATLVKMQLTIIVRVYFWNFCGSDYIR